MVLDSIVVSLLEELGQHPSRVVHHGVVMVAHREKGVDFDPGALRCLPEAILHRLVGLRVGSQQELPLRGATRHEPSLPGNDSTRGGHPDSSTTPTASCVEIDDDEASPHWRHGGRRRFEGARQTRPSDLAAKSNPGRDRPGGRGSLRSDGSPWTDYQATHDRSAGRKGSAGCPTGNDRRTTWAIRSFQEQLRPVLCARGKCRWRRCAHVNSSTSFVVAEALRIAGERRG